MASRVKYLGLRFERECGFHRFRIDGDGAVPARDLPFALFRFVGADDASAVQAHALQIQSLNSAEQKGASNGPRKSK